MQNPPLASILSDLPTRVVGRTWVGRAERQVRAAHTCLRFLRVCYLNPHLGARRSRATLLFPAQHQQKSSSAVYFATHDRTQPPPDQGAHMHLSASLLHRAHTLPRPRPPRRRALAVVKTEEQHILLRQFHALNSKKKQERTQAKRPPDEEAAGAESPRLPKQARRERDADVGEG